MATVVILVQGTNTSPWDELRRWQLETWMSSGQVRSHHYWGRSSKFISAVDSFHEYLRWSPLMGRGLRVVDTAIQAPMRLLRLPNVAIDPGDGHLQVSLPDLYLTGGMKFLSALQWVINEHNPEWIYRTTVSSYVDTHGLLEFLDGREPTNYYGGRQNDAPRGVFASGTHCLLSRDVANLVLEFKNRWPHRYLEDLALGVFLRDLKLPFQAISARSFTHPDQVGLLTDEELTSVWNFRCKSQNPDGSRLDGAIMRSLFSRYATLQRSNDGP